MSDPNVAGAERQAPVTASAPVLTSGAQLRQAREAQGLHIAALAVSLKVPVKKLEALEAYRFDLLPDTVFVRALASSVCRSLKIDPGPILDKLPHAAALPLKAYGSGVNVPFRSTGGHLPAFFKDQMSRPLVWVVSALVAGACALLLLPLSQRTEVVAVQPSATGDTTPAPVSLAPVGGAGNGTAVSQVVPTASAAGSAELVAGSGAVTGVVVFRAQALSWVEVVDASGVVQVRKNLATGEIVGASGVLPLTVVVGRADTTAVEVHGKPFDVLSIAKDNVAHFEVN